MLQTNMAEQGSLFLISNYGWRTAYIQMGIGTAILLFVASIGATTPEKKGLQPYGIESSTQEEVIKKPTTESGWSRAETLRSSAFWFICTLYFCTGFGTHLIAIHLVPFAESIGIEKVAAAWAWGLVGGISVLGRVITPAFVERTIGWRRGLVIIFAVSAATLLWV